MRIVAVSDTHNRHEKLIMPPGDMLIHCGDFSDYETPEEMQGFLEWFRSQDYLYKILVPGNHDSLLEVAIRDHQLYHIQELHKTFTQVADHTLGFHVLLGGPPSRLELRGSTYHLAGAPWSWIRNSKYRAFSLTNEESLGERFDEMFRLRTVERPLDILVTHVPPAGVLDSEKGIEWGSTCLRTMVEKQRPRLHLFGHVHAFGGQYKRLGSTLFANVACCGPKYNLDRQPMVFELSSDYVGVVSGGYENV